ncbi:MAG: hypothetical protein LBH13_00405 [Cellulomonadaceae bacterium]|jgi:hypothetical protein|nr:hypothetical protein [Cellulomonadaceae bacterium]
MGRDRHVQPSQLQEALERLNEALRERDRHLKIVAGGGFALLVHGLRATNDIDGFFEDTADLRELVHDIGEQLTINDDGEDWLNTSIAAMNDQPPDEYCSPVFTLSNITISVPDLVYVIGMKEVAGRDQDQEDIATIIRYLDLREPPDLIGALESYGFYPDEAAILDGFGDAYGFEWLETYYLRDENANADGIRVGHDARLLISRPSLPQPITNLTRSAPPPTGEYDSGYTVE